MPWNSFLKYTMKRWTVLWHTSIDYFCHFLIKCVSDTQTFLLPRRGTICIVSVNLNYHLEKKSLLLKKRSSIKNVDNFWSSHWEITGLVIFGKTDCKYYEVRGRWWSPTNFTAWKFTVVLTSLKAPLITVIISSWRSSHFCGRKLTRQW